MDDRQTEIRQGEGLTESRVNRDFIDFLNKWSSPVLMVLAVAALAYAGMQWLDRKKIEKINHAFGDLDAAMAGGNPSPNSLKTLATEYEGVGAVPEMALLATTDLYLNAFVRGIEPGAAVDRVTGQPTDANDLLDETQRGAYLEQAGQLAQEVIELTDGKEGKAILGIQAMIRLAAVQEGKRDFDAAKATYARAGERARDAGYPTLGNFADQRAAGVDALNATTALPGQDELTALPGEEPMSIDMLDEIMNAGLPTIESDPVEDAIDVENEDAPSLETIEDAVEDIKEAVEEAVEEVVEDLPVVDPQSDSP